MDPMEEGVGDNEEMMPIAYEEDLVTVISTASASTPSSSGDQSPYNQLPHYDSHLQREVKLTKLSASHSLMKLFRDFRARRAGILKALTTEAERFYRLCDPVKENLCLYGLPDETWDVNVPDDGAPPDMPEPVTGINFARVGQTKEEWLAFVAVHSDSWLLALTFYLGAHSGIDQESRRELFTMINDLPTIFEVVTGAAQEPTNERTPKNSSKSNKPASLPPSPNGDTATSKRANKEE